MIRNFADHSANERTFLAWIRTGIAVLGFGFVIEKFSVFLTAIASSTLQPQLQLHLDRIAGPLGREDGLALMLVGIVIIAVGAQRYWRTARLIDDPERHEGGRGRAEVVGAAGLALLAAIFCVYLVLV
jgi:inner membrane protein YidH